MEEKFMRKMLASSLIAVLLLGSGPLYAYEMKTGLVKKVTVNSPPMSARNLILELDGVSVMCSIPSNNQSAYLNKADAPDTFATYVSMLLTAQATGRAVTVHTIAGIEGCRIDQLHLTS
jgi:hypothetical protein